MASNSDFPEHTEAMVISHACVHCQDPSRIIKRLARHWAHRFEVVESTEGCVIVLTSGELLMAADAAVLTLRLQCAAENVEKLRVVVADHVRRMDGDNALEINWSAT